MKETIVKQLIKTAREFPYENEYEVETIANVRAERETNSPYNPEFEYNLYTKEFAGFDNGKPRFRWVNYGTMP